MSCKQDSAATAPTCLMRRFLQMWVQRLSHVHFVAGSLILLGGALMMAGVGAEVKDLKESRLAVLAPPIVVHPPAAIGPPPLADPLGLPVDLPDAPVTGDHGPGDGRPHGPPTDQAPNAHANDRAKERVALAHE